MKFLKITKKNLKKFLKDISFKDKSELLYFYSEKYKIEFIKNVLKNKKDTYLLADFKNNPIAIGGVKKIFHKNKSYGQIWLLCANLREKYRFSLFKVLKSKIEKYQEEHDILFNFIFKTNFESDLWLKSFGFKFKNLKNENFKLFYFKKKGKTLDI